MHHEANQRNTRRWAAVAALALAAAATLAGCSSDQTIGGDIVAPVTKNVNELQGETVDLVEGQVLNIDTQSLAVDSYQVELSERGVVEFTQGSDDGDSVMNPGFTALAAGSVDVTMINDQGGIQPLEFVINVTEP